MITKFQYIKNLAVFNDFAWDTSVIDSQGVVQTCKQINIMYGRNYSGKTTLSRIMRAFETGKLSDKYGAPTFTVALSDGTTVTQEDYPAKKIDARVFNEDFVTDNLRFITNPDDQIVPFAVLGEENAKLEAEIAELEAKLGCNIEGQETGAYAALKTATEAYSKAKKASDEAQSNLDKQKNEKATGRQVGIKYRADRFGNINYSIRNLNQDIETVLGATYKRPDKAQISTFESALTEQELPEPAEIRQIHTQLDSFVKIVKEICRRKIGTSEKIQELIHDVALNEWVHQGVSLNQERKTCAFCGQPLTDERWKALYQHFDEESETLQSDIENTQKLIKAEKDSIASKFMPIPTQFYNCYIESLNELVKQFGECCNAYIKKLDELLELLDARKRSISVPIPVEKEFNCEDGFLTVISAYGDLRQKSISYGKRIGEEKKKAQDALRLVEVDEFLSTILYREKIAQIEKLKLITSAAFDEKEKMSQAISSDLKLIESKRRLQNDEEKGAIEVNRYLQNFFGHRYLSLIAKEDDSSGPKKIYFEVERNGERAYHLSEGERSLIAFCYFVAKLKDVETVGKQPIIWIDDPISSLDGNHIYFVFSLIQNIILANNNFEQIFITTHNLLFLKYLRGLEKMRRSSANFVIERMGEYSTIKMMPRYLKEHGTEFNYWFSKIYLVAQSDGITDDNHFLFEAFGNNVRKFFETYLYYRYPDNKNDKERLRLLFQDEPIGRIIISKLYDEQSHAQGDLENHEVVFEEPEILSSARFIIQKLEEVDKTQFDALVASIS